MSEFELYAERSRAEAEREFDLRVKITALDMAIQAAPVLVSVTDNDEVKRSKIRRAAEEYEAYLKGESAS